MRKKIKKISIVLSIAFVFLGIMGFGQTNPEGDTKSITSDKTLQAWIYPEAPACNAANEYKDGRIIETLKAEYQTLNSQGSIITITAGCNAYTAANALDVKNYSEYQFVTVSGKENNLNALLNKTNSEVITDFIIPIVTLVNQIGFTGVELDLELPVDGWNAVRWSRYKYIINALGSELHKPVNNKFRTNDLSHNHLFLYN